MSGAGHQITFLGTHYFCNACSPETIDVMTKQLARQIILISVCILPMHLEVAYPTSSFSNIKV